MSIHIPIAKGETVAMMRSIIAPLEPTGRLVSDAQTSNLLNFERGKCVHKTKTSP
jgi:hypothetical protein